MRLTSLNQAGMRPFKAVPPQAPPTPPATGFNNCGFFLVPNCFVRGKFLGESGNALGLLSMGLR